MEVPKKAFVRCTGCKGCSAPGPFRISMQCGVGHIGVRRDGWAEGWGGRREGWDWPEGGVDGEDTTQHLNGIS
jgi:hypothetical protein